MEKGDKVIHRDLGLIGNPRTPGGHAQKVGKISRVGSYDVLKGFAAVPELREELRKVRQQIQHDWEKDQRHEEEIKKLKDEITKLKCIIADRTIKDMGN